MHPVARRPFLLLVAIVLLAAVGLIFRGGLAFGRMFALAEIAGFGLAVLWKLVLVVVVVLWLRSALRQKQD